MAEFNVPDDNSVEACERYVLIEKSRHNGDHYATTHPSIPAMNAYYACQEYPEDWEPVLVLDADNGERFDASVGYQVILTPQVAS